MVPAAHGGVEDVDVVVIGGAFAAAEDDQLAVDERRGVRAAGRGDVADDFGVGPLHGLWSAWVSECARECSLEARKIAA